MTIPTPRAARAPLIDTHVHIFENGFPLVADASNRPQYDFTAEELLETLDSEGVLFCVLTAPSFFGTYNDYVVEALRAHRRLRGGA